MDQIFGLRTKELSFLRLQLLAFAAFIAIIIIAPVLAVAAMFTTYGLEGNILTAEVAFSSLAFFTVMRFPLNNLGQAIGTLMQTRWGFVSVRVFLGGVGENVNSTLCLVNTNEQTNRVSANRMDAFLKRDEKPHTTMEVPTPSLPLIPFTTMSP